MNSNNIHYFSGLFDAEGSISTSTRQGFTPKISVAFSNCDARITHIAAKILNGTISTNNRPGYLPEYAVRVTSDKARRALQRMQPHLLEKQQQARLALAFPSAVKGQRYLQNSDLISFYEVKSTQMVLSELNKNPMRFMPEKDLAKLLSINRGEPRQAWLNNQNAALAYVAGLIDGDGTIFIQFNRRASAFCPTIAITSRHAPAMAEVKRYLIHLGIKTSLQVCHDKRPYNTCYSIRIFSHAAVAFARILKPHLMAKLDQATLMTELSPLMAGPTRGRVSDEIWKARENASKKMSVFNARFRTVVKVE